MHTRLFSSLLVLTLAGHAQAQTTGPSFPDPGKTSMSREQQHALGMQVAAEVYKTMPVLPDTSPESQYIRQLGQKLVATIPAKDSWPFEFHVIPQKDINAFALPGGQMFVNVGTITAAKNEAELAGVMGHEMAHVYMQHSAKQAGKTQTTSLIAGLAAVALDATVGKKAGGLVGEIGKLGIQVGAEGLIMKYSRNDESQADAVGAVVLYKAGYNPQGMVDFFKTMGAASGGNAPPQFFSSHPNPENRQQAIAKQIAPWPPVSYAGNSEAFDAVRQHAAQQRVYTAEEIAQGGKSGRWAASNEREGARFNAGGASNASSTGNAASAGRIETSAIALESVLPGAQMVKVDLGPLKLTHPDNWPVRMPKKQGEFVVVAPPTAVTASGVGYGLLMNLTAPPKGERPGIDERTRKLIEQIRQNNDFQQLGELTPIMVDGIEGRSAFLQSPSPFPDAQGHPQKERDWLVTVSRTDGALLFMIFVAPQNDFDRFRPTYEAMISGLQLNK